MDKKGYILNALKRADLPEFRFGSRGTTLFKKGLTENLFKKGFIENPSNGVINRRNGCGSTVEGQRLRVNG
jgi:hypothetical protein